MQKTIIAFIFLALMSCSEEKESPSADSQDAAFSLATSIFKLPYNLTSLIYFTPLTGKITYSASVGHKMTLEKVGSLIATSEGDTTLTNEADATDTIAITCGTNKIVEKFTLNTRSEQNFDSVTETLPPENDSYPYSCSYVKSGQDNKPFYPPNTFKFSTSDTTENGTRLIERSASHTSYQNNNSLGQPIYIFNMWLNYSQ